MNETAQRRGVQRKETHERHQPASKAGGELGRAQSQEVRAALQLDRGSPRGGDIQASAGSGVAGAGSALPHLATIQRSFGKGNDIGAVQAYVGGPAGQANEALGAEGYATGEKVAFKSAPGLHLAAHEAAHVIQQRRGVQLSGGVGAAGDAYERQADQVADRVVQGNSAADLLPSGPGSGGGAAGIQARQAVQRQEKKAETPLDGDYSTKDNAIRDADRYYLHPQYETILSAIGWACDELEHQDTDIAAEILKSAAKIGLAAAAGALGAIPGVGLATGALIWGLSAALGEGVDRVFSGNEMLNVASFREKRKDAWTIEGLRAMRKNLDDLMGKEQTEAGWMRVAKDWKKSWENRSTIKNIHKDNTLDHWISALSKKAHKSGEGDVYGEGAESYGSATTGRLHVNLVVQNPNSGLQVRARSSASIEGLKRKMLRDRYLTRKLKDIGCFKQFGFYLTTYYYRGGGGQRELGGLMPDPKPNSSAVAIEGSKSWKRALGSLASSGPQLQAADHDDYDHRIEGALRVWNLIKGRTLKQLGVTSITD